MSVRKEVSSMATPCSSSNVSEQFMVADWDPLHSAGGSNVMSSYNVASEQIPSFAGFGNENLCELMGSFVLPESTSLCPQDDFRCTNELANDKNLKGKKRKKLPEHGSPMSVEGENVKSPIEKDDKKESSKEDYIHIRAKRGQATNSHSLAERVRREKISERMRLLQDLVPGCNKITGKAVMLDEIINYVQSLQKQVEFLSMKLSTVNPEINLDTEQIFTKENLHSIRYGSSAAFAYGPELGMPHRHLQAEIAMPSRLNSTDFLRIANAHTSHMPQPSGSWDHEFQNALQMGFIPNLHYDGTEMTGSRKTEL